MRLFTLYPWKELLLVPNFLWRRRPMPVIVLQSVRLLFHLCQGDSQINDNIQSPSEGNYSIMDTSNIFLWWFGRAVEGSFSSTDYPKANSWMKLEDWWMFHHQWCLIGRYIEFCCGSLSWCLVWCYEYSLRGIAIHSSKKANLRLHIGIACMLQHSPATTYHSSVIM